MCCSSCPAAGKPAAGVAPGPVLSGGLGLNTPLDPLSYRPPRGAKTWALLRIAEHPCAQVVAPEARSRVSVRISKWPHRVTPYGGALEEHTPAHGRLPRTCAIPSHAPQGNAGRQHDGGAHPGARQVATRTCASPHGPHRLTPDGSTLVEHISSEQPRTRSRLAAVRRYSALVCIQDAEPPGAAASLSGISSSSSGCAGASHAGAIARTTVEHPRAHF